MEVRLFYGGVGEVKILACMRDSRGGGIRRRSRAPLKGISAHFMRGDEKSFQGLGSTFGGHGEKAPKQGQGQQVEQSFYF